MGIIDYSLEPKSDIAFVDMKSFYASVECIKRGLYPLKTSLCVMSRADNSNGLILASSPTFKKVFGKENVGRSRDLPFDIHTRKFSYENAIRQNIKITKEYIKFIEYWASRTFIVPPRMALYIEENLKIQNIFKKFSNDNEIYPYSIDETFLDLTNSLNYFVKDDKLSKKEKLDLICSKIQHEIQKETGLFSTIGMSNSNPLLAKLALDNEAKKNKAMRANWSYEDVENKVWNIKKLTDFWGIGKRIAKRLENLGIFSIKDLANSNPDILKKEFGIIGVQMWFHANGVDESNLKRPYKAKSKGIGSSQVLPRNYSKEEAKIVLLEMVEDLSTRLRKIHKKTSVISLYIGFSYDENLKSINVSEKISATQSTQELSKSIIKLFNEKYVSGEIRNIGVHFNKLSEESYTILTLFDDNSRIEKINNLDKTIDKIRDKYGYLCISKGISLLNSSRIKERKNLIGGHHKGESNDK